MTTRVATAASCAGRNIRGITAPVLGIRASFPACQHTIYIAKSIWRCPSAPTSTPGAAVIRAFNTSVRDSSRDATEQIADADPEPGTGGEPETDLEPSISLSGARLGRGTPTGRCRFGVSELRQNTGGRVRPAGGPHQLCRGALSGKDIGTSDAYALITAGESDPRRQQLLDFRAIPLRSAAQASRSPGQRCRFGRRAPSTRGRRHSPRASAARYEPVSQWANACGVAPPATG